MKHNIYPKFEQAVKDKIDHRSSQILRETTGVVISYDSKTNTVNVIVEERDTLSLNEVYKNVPCPFTYGVQTVAPDVGTRCILGFRDNNGSDPYVINFVVDSSARSQPIVRNSISFSGIPRFMT